MRAREREFASGWFDFTPVQKMECPCALCGTHTGVSGGVYTPYFAAAKHTLTLKVEILPHARLRLPL